LDLWTASAEDFAVHVYCHRRIVTAFNGIAVKNAAKRRGCFHRDCGYLCYLRFFGRLVGGEADEKQEIFLNQLQGFKDISVREEAGAKIVKELTGREAVTVLDPTLLLDISQYKKIQKKPASVPNGKYVLVYLLGGRTEIFSEYVQSSMEYKEAELYDILQWKASGRQLPVGPAEFIYLVNHSEMVLTDSFHATVFATIFHKPVRTFPRGGIDISSRIVSLASSFGLGTNFTADGVFYINEDANYGQIEEHLNEEREKSIRFLKIALG